MINRNIIYEHGKLHEELLNLIIEASCSALILTDKNGIIVLANLQFEKIFGYKKKEILGEKVEVLIPKHLDCKHTKFRDEYMFYPNERIMGKGRDLIAVKKNGDPIPVEIGLSPIELNSETFVLASIIDITERKQRELEIKQAKERLSAIMDNTPDAIYEFDETGDIMSINNEARITYFPEIEKNKIWDIIPTETLDSYRVLLSEVKNGRKVKDFETKRITIDGTKKTVSISLTYIKDDMNRYIETTRDMSDRIAMRSKIIEIEKSQIIGKMAQGIAHHIGTPLASILLRVQMLKEDFENSAEMKQYLDKLNQIEKQIGYGQKTLNRILKFVGRPTYDKRMTNLSQLVKESIEIVKPFLTNNNVIIKTSIPEYFELECEQNLLQMVISDLIMNSIDAISTKGRITVSAKRDNSDDNNIVISIKDNGSGIPKKVLPFIFEPFYTTKTNNRGTGLGLAVAKNVIQEHNGDIRIESKMGIGTEAIMILPFRQGKIIH